MNGNTSWLFEVKSTTAAGPDMVQSLELGSTEFRRAEACKAERKARYRYLYVTDALNPENARIFRSRTREAERDLRSSRTCTPGIGFIFRSSREAAGAAAGLASL